MQKVCQRLRPCPWIKKFLVIVLVSTGILITGCVRYEPKPLIPDTVFEEVQRVTLDDLITNPQKQLDGVSGRIDLNNGLDADEIAYAALFLNPSLKAKHAEKGIGAGQLIDANIWPNPEIGSNFRWEKGGHGRSFEPELSFEVLRWGERKGKRQAAQAKVEETHFEILAEEWKVVSDARAAYWEVVGLLEKVRVNKQALEIAQKLSQSVRTLLARGQTTAMDVNLSEIERARAELEVKRAEGELSSAKRNLSLVIGLPPGSDLKLQLPEKPLARVTMTWTFERVEKQLTGTALMKSAEWHYQASEGDLRAAIARQYPSLRIGPSNSIELDGHWTAFIGFLVSTELPILNQNRGEIREKLAVREKSRADYVARLHELRGGLAEAFGRLEGAELQLDFLEMEILPKAQEALRLMERSYDAGAVNVLELFKANSSIIGTKQEYLKALLEYRTALQGVERALGRPINIQTDLPNQNSQSNPPTKITPENKPGKGE